MTPLEQAVIDEISKNNGFEALAATISIPFLMYGIAMVIRTLQGRKISAKPLWWMLLVMFASKAIGSFKWAEQITTLDVYGGIVSGLIMLLITRAILRN